jgi:hypothetical protein
MTSYTHVIEDPSRGLRQSPNEKKWFAPISDEDPVYCGNHIGTTLPYPIMHEFIVSRSGKYKSYAQCCVCHNTVLLWEQGAPSLDWGNVPTPGPEDGNG